MANLLGLRIHAVLSPCAVPHVLTAPQEVVIADLGGCSRALALRLKAIRRNRRVVALRVYSEPLPSLLSQHPLIESHRGFFLILLVLSLQ